MWQSVSVGVLFYVMSLSIGKAQLFSQKCGAVPAVAGAGKIDDHNILLFLTESFSRRERVPERPAGTHSQDYTKAPPLFTRRGKIFPAPAALRSGGLPAVRKCDILS